METEHLIGIYKIESLDGRIYIGSSKNIRHRIYTHRHLLNKNKHSNRFLQAAWNKHGAEHFTFSVVELTSSSENLWRLEQIWLDRIFSTYNRDKIYNIAREAGRSIEAHTMYRFLDPDGLEIETDNLPRFCAEHNLNYIAMHNVVNGGHAKTHRGYRRIGAEIPKCGPRRDIDKIKSLIKLFMSTNLRQSSYRCSSFLLLHGFKVTQSTTWRIMNQIREENESTG